MEDFYHLHESGTRDIMLYEDGDGMLLDSSGILVWNGVDPADGTWTGISKAQGIWVESNG